MTAGAARSRFVFDEGAFHAHIDLLGLFVSQRRDVVEHLQQALNAQRHPVERLQDRSLWTEHVEDCFFGLAAVDHDHRRLRRQLEDTYEASGFRPRELPGLYNGPIDPAEMMVRGFHIWQHTHWPGRNGRVRYAHTLFNLYVIRSLALLCLRLWDSVPSRATERLSHVQEVLDRLWATTPADQPVIVRDAHWLIPLAQSPATDDLGAYFEVAAHVADTFSHESRLEIHRANVVMAAGHLRSQTRYYALKHAVPPDDHSILLTTRTSNALDFALLIQDLVPLLDAYERAWHDDDVQKRLALADTILQGLSPDPELFVNRVELLGAYSMLEDLFVSTDLDTPVAYTGVGQRHVHHMREYRRRIAQVSGQLRDDCALFRPEPGGYSPYGVLYGFSTNLVEHMALRTLQPDAPAGYALEDVFARGGADKLAWVNGWRKLPHLTRDVEQQFEYPQPFAEAMFARLERALQRASEGDANADTRVGRLVVVPDVAMGATTASTPPQLATRFIGSSDRQLVAAGAAVSLEAPQLLRDRREGRCMLSYHTSGGWVAISKAVLTDILGAGLDATVTGLPARAADVLTLTCPSLVILSEGARPSA